MNTKEGLHLFELIKAMTKSEKRFFKLSAQKHSREEESIYVKLFDAIEKQKAYNEASIKDVFKDEPFIERLAMEKYNLYRILLRVLNDYNYETSVDYKILEGIKNAKILHSKMLFEQSKKALEAAKKLALKYDKYPFLLEILENERHCVNSVSDPETIEKALPDLFNQSMDATKTFLHLTNYIGIFKDYMLTRKNYYSVRNDKEKNRLQKIFESLIHSEDEEQITFEEYFRKNNLLSFYSMAAGNREDAYTYCKRIVTAMENDPDKIKENPERYVSTVYNLIMRCDLLKQKDESAMYYKRIINLSSEYKIKEIPHVHYIIFRLDLYKVNRSIRYMELKEGLKLLDKIDTQLKENKIRVNWESVAIYNYNAAYLCFVAEEYKRTLKHLNKIILLNRKNHRNDVFGYARIMNLLVHYELDNVELILYAARSTYRFLEKTEMLNKTERIIYKFMSQKVPKIAYEKEADKMEAFRELKEEITEIADHPFESGASEYFDIISWVDSKLSKRKFAEVMKEKSNTYA